MGDADGGREAISRLDGTDEAGSAPTFGLDSIAELFRLDSDALAVDPLLGVDVGGVTLVRLIGEGGMGRVYEAIQDRPRRPVAVKIMRPGFASRETYRRFLREAEILGRLRHPGIAQIFAAGVCPIAGSQVPFFVMEFMPDALPITEYAAVHALAIDERLKMMRSVCDAVAHGHDQGVVHPPSRVWHGLGVAKAAVACGVCLDDSLLRVPPCRRHTISATIRREEARASSPRRGPRGRPKQQSGS